MVERTDPAATVWTSLETAVTIIPIARRMTDPAKADGRLNRSAICAMLSEDYDDIVHGEETGYFRSDTAITTIKVREPKKRN